MTASSKVRRGGNAYPKGRGRAATLRAAAGLALRASPRAFGFSLALSAGAALLPALIVWLSKQLVDGAASRSGLRSVITVAVALGLATGLQSLLRAVQNNHLVVASRQVGHVVLRQVLAKASSVPLAVLDAPAWHDRYSRVVASAGSRPGAITTALVQTVGAVTALTALAGVLAFLHPGLVLLAILGELPLLFFQRRITESMYRYQVASSTAEREKTYLAQLLSDPRAAKDVRAFALDDALLERFDATEQGLVAKLRPVLRFATSASALGAVSTAVALTASYSLVAWLAQRGELSAGAVAAVIAGVALAASQVGSVIAGLRRLDDEALLFLSDLDIMLEEQSEDLTAAPGKAAAAVTGAPDELRVEALGFAYPGAPRLTLRDINFHVRRGEMLAIVGENGAGKTTLVKLLLALYQPTTGSIRLDGVDIADMGIGNVRTAFGVLFQDFVPFEFTVTENVTAGRIGGPGDPRAVSRALRQARADEFCERLDDGLDTVVGRMLGAGHDLSGGQWQRLALARLFYRDPDIWILDEPTAALDPEAEAQVFAELRDALRDRIAIVISHRFSTVSAADRILVLEDGTISESGTHDELLANGRRYAHLYNLQAAAFQ